MKILEYGKSTIDQARVAMINIRDEDEEDFEVTSEKQESTDEEDEVI
jgi:hypothetical protein